MIAGLLESNQKIRWTFDKFFYSTNDIMNKITVKVFDCSTGINNKLYIDKTDRYVCHDAIHLFWRKKEMTVNSEIVLVFDIMIAICE